MIVGAHVVVASKDADADHKFFREVLKLDAVDAGGGYLIFGLPKSEVSIHPTEGVVPHHELYFLCDDIDAFVDEMNGLKVECGDVNDAGWGKVVQITLPSGAPLHVYEPRHARP